MVPDTIVQVSRDHTNGERSLRLSAILDALLSDPDVADIVPNLPPHDTIMYPLWGLVRAALFFQHCHC